MSDSPLAPEEIRAAAAAHHDLGPEYSDAVVASFLEKVDREVAARVDARMATMRQPVAPASADSRQSTLLKGIAIGIGVSAMTAFVVGGNPDERLHRMLWLLLIFIVLIGAAGAARAGRRIRSREADRARRLTG
jgi:hypothetical protein